jgi:hypothetical protein
VIGGFSAASGQTDEVRSAVTLDSIADVIYCVVPEPLADELYDRLASYYEEDPNVTVIVDRRRGSRREPGSSGGGQRELRDRRRHRVAGEFPPIANDES